jgi:hypothetical protein
MGHCKNCRHWTGNEWPRCTCDKFVWDDGEVDVPQDGVLIARAVADQPYILTAPGFGCFHFSSRRKYIEELNTGTGN